MIDEYSKKTSFENDLDFALSLSLKISYFVIDIVKVYTENSYRDFIFEF